MTKIVYNACYGGFGLSEAAKKRYRELKGIGKSADLYDFDLERDDPILVQVVEELGSDAASGGFANLQIAEIPVGERYRIDEYDGIESVMTVEDYDWSIAR